MKKILALAAIASLTMISSSYAEETASTEAPKSTVSKTKKPAPRKTAKVKKSVKKANRPVGNATSQTTDSKPGEVRTMQDELLAE